MAKIEFQSVWIDHVKDMICCPLIPLSTEVRFPRVARLLWTTKPEAYIPQFLSLGPYHHSRLETDGTYQYCGLKMSTAEAYKVISAATIYGSAAEAYKVISAATIYGSAAQMSAAEAHKVMSAAEAYKVLAEVLEKIKGIQPHIVSSYDLQIPPDPDFLSNYALMMVVDACFLLCFIFGCLGVTVFDWNGPDIELIRVWIKCDILKLENQIPLSVLKLVFEDARKLFVGPLFCPSVNSFEELLQAAYKVLSPFDILLDVYHPLPRDAMNDLEREPHILGCIHRIVSGILELGLPQGGTLLQRIYSFIDKYVVVKLCGILFCFTPPTDIDRLIKGYSAGQLARAGVKFKSFSEWDENIRFEECSHTLYLPYLKITSSLQTEVFFRNLVALEFNEPARRKAVTRYVALMDSLIDTPDDVRALMDADVISRGSLMLTEEHIAQMWDGMCQPFVTGHLEPPLVLKNAFVKEVERKYYKVKAKIRLAETWEYCYGRFFSRPWKIVALLFAIFLLLLNCIQAYCSLYKCRSDS